MSERQDPDQPQPRDWDNWPPVELMDEARNDLMNMIDGNGASGADLADRARELADRIIGWWTKVADADAQAAAAKSTEYGGSGAALDLVWMGQQLADFGLPGGAQTGMRSSTLTDQQATELGIFVYVLGKVARWKAAIIEGRPVSDDTLKDLHTYAMMARYNREHGSWP